MEITLKRDKKRKHYTLGTLSIEGEPFCSTLEPTWRDIGPGGKGRKVLGKTAIPEGRYPLYVTRSPKFGQWLPLLLHVPQFKGVRIHAGNLPADTEGCILVGEYNEETRQLECSTLYVRLLKQRIVEAKERGEGVWITVK